jgi:hypothetical protein
MSVEPETDDNAEQIAQEIHENEEAVTLPRREKVKWWQSPDSGPNDTRRWGCIFPLLIVGIVAYWGYLGYGWLDGEGWIEHNHDTPVWIKGEWLAGEYRLCRMPLSPNQSLPLSAHLLCGQSGVDTLKDENAWPTDFVGSISDHEFFMLMAGQWSDVEQHFHVLPVNYWGKINRSNRTMFSWRCQRNGDSLTCKALN